MDSAQRVDEKNGAICLVIIFTPGVMVIKMSKMAHFLYFLQMTAKNQLQFGHNIWVHLKDLIQRFQKCYGLLDSELPLARCQPLKIEDFGVFC